MFPIEAPRELHTRVFHRLGDKQYVLTLQLQSGDDVAARVIQPFQQGRLPACLYRPTLEYAALAVRQALADGESPRLQVAEVSAPASGGLCLETLTGEARSDLQERLWPRLLGASGGVRAPAPEAVFWCACDFLLRHRPAFFRTVGTLEDSYLKAVREKQAGRADAVSELQRCQSIEMERVRQQAEKEECASQDVQSLVAQHVSQIDALELHWRTEIEELKHHQKTAYREYVVDFFESEAGQLGDVGAPAGLPAASGGAGPPQLGEPLRAESLARPLRPARPAGGPAGAGSLGAGPLGAEGGAQGAAPGASFGASLGAAGPVAGAVPRGAGAEDAPRRAGRLLEFAEVRAVFGQRRVFFVLRLWAGDITDLLAAIPAPRRAETGHAGGGAGGEWVADADDADGAGPQLPPDCLGIASYGHRFLARGSALAGGGAAWPRVRPPATPAAAPAPAAPAPAAPAPAAASGAGPGVFRSASLHFWEAPSMPPPVRLSPNAYAHRLRGLVIPTPENLKFEATAAVMLREFAGHCDRVADLHFPPLSKQLEHVRAITADAPLRSGDYFCTRHSNLGGVVQAAFHLLTGSSEAPASDEVSAATHRALKRIVCDCHRCCVAELSLPLLLLDIGASESTLPYAIAQRRAENSFRALKGALTRLAEELAPSETPGLQVVNCVLPLSCAQSLQPGWPSVAETTLTFLQHSFQCV